MRAQDHDDRSNPDRAEQDDGAATSDRECHQADDRRSPRAQLVAGLGYLGVVGVLLGVPSGGFFGRALAVTAASIALIEILELLRWCGKGYLACHLKGLCLRIIGARLAASSGIVLAGYMISPGPGLVFAASAGSLVLLVSHLRTEGRLQQRIEEDGEPEPKTPRARRALVLSPEVMELKRSRSVTETLSETLDVFGRWPRIPKYALVVIGPLATLCLAALALGLGTGDWIGQGRKTTTSTGPTATVPKQEKPAAPAPLPYKRLPEAPGSPPSIAVWDGISCPSVAQHSGASAKAILQIAELYAPGAFLSRPRKGCIGQVVRRYYPRARETYFTTIGTNPVSQEKLTYSLDSEKFGTVLLLWSISALVKAIVERVGPVGGVGRFPYYEVSGGEFFLLRCRVASRVGNVLLIRRSVTEEWVELPPTAARAWAAHIIGVWHWLWPSQPEHEPGGEVRFALSTGAGEPQGTIDVSSTGEAELAGVSYPVVPAHEVDLPELSKHFGQP